MEPSCETDTQYCRRLFDPCRNHLVPARCRRPARKFHDRPIPMGHLRRLGTSPGNWSGRVRQPAKVDATSKLICIHVRPQFAHIEYGPIQAGFEMLGHQLEAPCALLTPHSCPGRACGQPGLRPDGQASAGWISWRADCRSRLPLSPSGGRARRAVLRQTGRRFTQRNPPSLLTILISEVYQCQYSSP